MKIQQGKLNYKNVILNWIIHKHTNILVIECS